MLHTFCIYLFIVILAANISEMGLHSQNHHTVGLGTCPWSQSVTGRCTCNLYGNDNNAFMCARKRESEVDCSCHVVHSCNIVRTRSWHEFNTCTHGCIVHCSAHWLSEVGLYIDRRVYIHLAFVRDATGCNMIMYSWWFYFRL